MILIPKDYEWIIEYILERPATKSDYKEEWEWHRFFIDDKMIAAICINKDQENIISLKCIPSLSQELQDDYRTIKPGFYMNKKHWISINLDGTVDNDKIKYLIDISYDLIFEKLTKKRQIEIKDGIYD